MQVLRGGLPGKAVGGSGRGVGAVASHRRLSAVQVGQCEISATFSRYGMGRWSHRGGGITRQKLSDITDAALRAAEAHGSAHRPRQPDAG